MAAVFYNDINETIEFQEGLLNNLATDSLVTESPTCSSSSVSSSGRFHRKALTYFPVVMCMIYAIPMVMIYPFSAIATTVVVSRTCNEDGEPTFSLLTVKYTTISSIICDVFVFLGYPLAGWLADTKFGRLKCITASLWFLWFGMILLVTGSLLIEYPGGYYSVDCNKYSLSYKLGNYVFLPISVILLAVAATVFFPNILAFMLDQLVDSSNSVLNSIIRWFTWSLFVGIFFSYLVVLPLSFAPDDVADNLPVITIWMAVLCSLILVVHVNILHHFQSHPPKPENSPYKIVFNVLKFAWRHNFPINRSALTYWEEKVPNRIDLAKQKYGGPYTTENVEDVKTFLRIMIFLFAMCMYYIPYASLGSELIQFLRHLHHTTDLQYRQWIIYLLDPLTTIIFIPILELFILVLFPKFEYVLMKSSIWIGLGTVLLALSMLSFLLIDIAAHYTSHNVNETEVCFLKWSIEDATESLSYGWVAIPALFWGFSDLFVAPSMFLFICRQAPYTMRGMLLGCFLLFQQIAYFFGTQISTLFTVFPSNTVLLSCGVLFWGLEFVLSLFGIVSFTVASKTYRPRERQEIEQHVRIIESIYDRQLFLREQYEKLFYNSKNKSHDFNYVE